MAIWQFKLEVIPQKSVIERFGEIPKTLEINREGWNDFWQKITENIKSEPDFEDALTINWWTGVFFDKPQIISAIDKLISYSKWEDDSSITWKGDVNQNQDHDAFLCFDESGNVEEFHFRTDLRGNFTDFLTGMLEICRSQNWLVMDGKGNLVEPNPAQVFDLIQTSNSVRFLTDPQKFFKDLESGEIKPE
ncbi:MAG TPA: hypothetical protein VF721_17190 [Pyrinomonadaceae bacterium]|jgi:hypothetical protein